MLVENVTFETLDDAPAELLDRWRMRVIVQGRGFEMRALPLVVEVGTQRLQLLVPLTDDEGEGLGVMGLLPGEPQPGDEVRVGYADAPLIPSGFAFSEDDT